jgi:hypothetical protein
MRKSCSWRNTTAGEETGLDLVSRPRLTMDDGRRTSIEEGIAKIRGRSHPQAALEAATQTDLRSG